MAYGRTGNLIINQSPWYNRTGWLSVKHQFTYLLDNNALTTQIKRKFRKNERGQRMAIKTNKVFDNKEMRPTRRGSSEQIKETKPKRQTEAKTQLCRGNKWRRKNRNKQTYKMYKSIFSVCRFYLVVLLIFINNNNNNKNFCGNEFRMWGPKQEKVRKPRVLRLYCYPGGHQSIPGQHLDARQTIHLNGPHATKVFTTSLRLSVL